MNVRCRVVVRQRRVCARLEVLRVRAHGVAVVLLTLAAAAAAVHKKLRITRKARGSGRFEDELARLPCAAVGGSDTGTSPTRRAVDHELDHRPLVRRHRYRRRRGFTLIGEVS
jgi:hypothetical protein